MLLVGRHRARTCSGISRRELLQVGASSVLGLSLPRLLAQSSQGGKAKSVLLLWLWGGPSQLDTWDPKPDAPSEFRGPFGTIPTRLPGVRLCELFPMQAQLLDRAAILNGVRSVENDHYLSEVYTGLPRSAGSRPAFGSVASKLLGGSAALPTYVSLHEVQAFDRF